jgi:hypothetical protein
MHYVDREGYLAECFKFRQTNNELKGRNFFSSQADAEDFSITVFTQYYLFRLLYQKRLYFDEKFKRSGL